MAIFHLSMKPISRVTGRSAVGAAAYRAGVKIVDERTGEVHDYSRKRGIEYRELVFPGGGTEDRGQYWNRVEKHHKRGDAVLSREVEIALPEELTAAQRQRLASVFNRELADKYNIAADLNIHRPHRAKADTRNHHGHIMLSACYTAADGSLGKKAVELDPIHCQRNKLENAADFARKRWAELVNEALKKAGHKTQIDHNSLEKQREVALFCVEHAAAITNDPAFKPEQIKKAAELDRPATIHLGPVATAMERRGIRTERGDYNRRAMAQVIDLAAVRAEQEPIKKQLAEIEWERRQVSREIEEATKAVQDVVADPAPRSTTSSKPLSQVQVQPVLPPAPDVFLEGKASTKPLVSAPPAQSEALPPLPLEAKPTPPQPAFTPLPKAVEPVPAPMTLREIEARIKEIERAYWPTAAEIEADNKVRFPALQAAKDRLTAIIEAIQKFNRQVKEWQQRGKNNGWETDKTYLRQGPRDWQQEGRELNKQGDELSADKKQATNELERVEAQVRFHGGAALKEAKRKQMEADPEYKRLDAERMRMYRAQSQQQSQQTQGRKR